MDLAAPGWAVVGYSRAQALAERAVLPVLFGTLDGEASWLDHDAKQPDGTPSTVGPHRLSGGWQTETTRPALFTALRTSFAGQLLREAFDATRALRASRREARGLAPGMAARGRRQITPSPKLLHSSRERRVAGRGRERERDAPGPYSSTLVPFAVAVTERNLGLQLLGVLRMGGVDYRLHGTV